MAWVLSPYPHLSQITTIWVAHNFLTCHHLKQCRCHCHGDSLCSTPQHTLQLLSCNMLFRFPLGGLQHTRPHTWFWCLTSSPVQQLQLPLSSVKPFYPNSISLPLSEVARIHVAVCHLKNSVTILEPLPVAYVMWFFSTISKITWVKEQFGKIKKNRLLELASVFVPIVVHCSAVAIL